MRTIAWALALWAHVCCAQTLAPVRSAGSPSEIRGAALARDGRLFTWGDALHVWSTQSARPTLLAKGTFGEGGCLVDIDGDGREELVSKEGAGLGPLTWRRPPDYKPVVLEAQTDTHDCMEATLFGRKGVLAVHRFMQVRFYEPAEAGRPWRMREIYSIYTPSQQTGLSLRDVNGDGFVDILCGNYWIQSPDRFELPWHIFAVNTWFEEKDSAMLIHRSLGNGAFYAQAHLSPARVATFEKPEDPRKLWNESRVPGNFSNVHAAASYNGGIIFAENNGAASRIFEIRDGSAHVLASGQPVLHLFTRGETLISVGPRQVTEWHYRRR